MLCYVRYIYVIYMLYVMFEKYYRSRVRTVAYKSKVPLISLCRRNLQLCCVVLAQHNSDMQYGRNRATGKSNFGRILVLVNIFLIVIFRKTNCIIELRLTAQVNTTLAQFSTIKKKLYVHLVNLYMLL